ncbi:APC family permease [Mycoplasma enhydrae]|uniref:APC family permease n=1 Tax=Mycoplasma enhydrae TaxID=2499220 RepID=UPI0021E7D8CA|nr:APC family permease [Mycoplasma enhydrae]MCV3733901.1 APC family permease [Mycoplasma enhydrae]
MAEEQMVVTSSTKKKISFFAAIMVVIGASIGVGIFLRSKTVLEYSAGNIALSLATWLIAGFAVITLALALVEVASGRNDNLGMIGWTKAFNTLYIYKANKFFMTYLYLPFTYFFMPYYVIVQFQDGLQGFGMETNFGGSSSAPWFYFLIGLVLTLWMLFSAGLSGRAGNIQNLIITSVKFIPLVAIVIIGFVYFSQRLSQEPTTIWTPITVDSLFKKESTSFLKLTPVLGIFGSLAGIFFAFDGFYVSAGIQSEMKNPEKTPAALVIGLFSMTLMYIIIAAAMSLGAKSGGFYDFGGLLEKSGHKWAFGVINIMIAIGVLGILNGFSMWATRFVEDLIKEGEIYIPAKAYRYMKHSNTPIVGMLFCLILSLPFMVVLTVIGAYAYIDLWDVDGSNVYGANIGKLLSFSDLMADWMAVFAFAFIAFSVIGVLENRKKHFIAVKENKHTVWAGYIAITMVMLTMIIKMLDPFLSLGLVLGQYMREGADVAKLKPDLIAYSATSGLFILYMVIIFASTPIEKKIALSKQIKYAQILKSELCECKSVAYCPCKIADVKEANELNELVLHSYATARLA